MIFSSYPQFHLQSTAMFVIYVHENIVVVADVVVAAGVLVELEGQSSADFDLWKHAQNNSAIELKKRKTEI